MNGIHNLYKPMIATVMCLSFRIKFYLLYNGCIRSLKLHTLVTKRVRGDILSAHHFMENKVKNFSPFSLIRIFIDLTTDAQSKGLGPALEETYSLFGLRTLGIDGQRHFSLVVTLCEKKHLSLLMPFSTSVHLTHE